MENAAFTFEQLLYGTSQDNPEHGSSATEKAKHRVLKVRTPPCVPVDPLWIHRSASRFRCVLKQESRRCGPRGFPLKTDDSILMRYWAHRPASLPVLTGTRQPDFL